MSGDTTVQCAQPAAPKAGRGRAIVTAVLTAVGCAALIAAGFTVAGKVLPSRDVTLAGAISSPSTKGAPSGPADYPGPGVAAVDVVIPDGVSARQFAQVLLDAGVVATAEAATDAYAANPQVSVIHPGTYVLLTQMRAADAVAALVLIANQPVVVRIPEGYTVTRALDRIAAVTGISSSDLAAAVADPASIGIPPDAIGPGAADGDRAGANRRIEGWLFPTTYLVRSSDTAVTVLSAMVARTIQELTDQSVAPADWHNTLVKASIVMREALPADYAKVARVIDNRLAGCGGDGTLGMDAIDSYGLGIPADMITRAQFAAPDLPYASRVHQGLPPTPIANPGSAAIAATINPTEGDWCWFVTVNLDTGETKFTGSYQEFLQFSAELTDWLAAKAAQTTPAATQ